MLLYGALASEASVISLIVCLCFFYVAAIVAHSNRRYSYKEKEAMLRRGGVTASVVEQLPFWTAAKGTMSTSADDPQIGLPSVLYLRFCRMLVETFGMFGLLGILILAPANWTGGGGQHGLERLCASNLLYGSERATLHCLYAVGLTIAVYGNMQLYRKFCVARLREAADHDTVTERTVMIKHFPFQIMDEDFLRAHLEFVFKGTVENVRIDADQSPKIKLIQRRQFVIEQLDAFRGQLREKNVRPKLVSGPLKALGQGEKVDAISVLAAEKERLEEQLELLQGGALSNSGHAFITFSSKSAADDFRLRGQEALFEPTNERSYALEAFKWRLLPAPPPGDLIFQNLPLNPDGRIAPLLLAILGSLCSLCVIVLPILVVVALGDNRVLGAEFAAMFIPPLVLVLMRELMYPLFFADAVSKVRPTTRSSSRSLTFWLNCSANILGSVVVPYACFGWLNVYYQKLSMSKGLVQTSLAALYSVGGQFLFTNSFFMSGFLSTGVQLLFYAFRPMLAMRSPGGMWGQPNEPIYFNYPREYALTIVLATMVFACAAVSPVVMVAGTLCLAVRFLVDKYHHLQTYTRRDDYAVHTDPNSACVALVGAMLLFHLSLFHWFAGQSLWPLAIISFLLALFDTTCIITPRVRDQWVTIHPLVQDLMPEPDPTAKTDDAPRAMYNADAYNIPEVQYPHQVQHV